MGDRQANTSGRFESFAATSGLLQQVDGNATAEPFLERSACVPPGTDNAATVELRDFLPAIIGSFVGVMGWLLVGLLIQRRQFVRQGRNAAKAVYFELDVNLATIGVARDHGLFADLDRSSFERLLPELATLLSGSELQSVVDAYMTHAGYRQVASRDDLPAEVRRAALAAHVGAHERALATLRSRAFSDAELRAMEPKTHATPQPTSNPKSVARTKP